jgi:splicing factor U2AF subunit
MKNMYIRPSVVGQENISRFVAASLQPIDEKEAQEHFDDFYQEVFSEMSKFGTIEEMNVCANFGDHLFGNVYIKFCTEDEAQAALSSLQGRFYAGKAIWYRFI